jgi:Protein of unknown function (DUF2950)
MKLQGKNLTGSVLFTGILVIGLLNIAGSGMTIKAAAATDAAPQTFSTPEQAGQALRAAAGSNDENALANILGAESKPILFSGDAAEDKAAIADFVAKYDRMNRWVTMTDGSRVLYIGADNYPYPIPLALNSDSKWYFNTAAGKDEVLARRIGKNELLAIDAVSAMANAEALYFKSSHDGNPPHRYTDKILSTSGKQDGLYWQVPADKHSSPLGRLNEFAKDVVTSTQPGSAPIFDGYSFRIVTSPEGKSFTIVATPVTYGDSGIMTFILSKDGQVQQKDLGANTASLAVSINSYDLGDGWMSAE